ncbi:MAG: hypothetical protein HAW66_03900, partial [Shewanella sp.]|nr:hypothetical protein [Shewanella sp.]
MAISPHYGVNIMNWRYIKLVIRFLIYLPIGFLVLFALLIGTTFGSKITINALDLFVPSLSLEYGSGIINKELSLNAAGWQSNNVSVVTSNLTVKWNPNCILRKQLCLTSLSATDTHIDIIDKQQSRITEINAANTDNYYYFPLPFTIQVDHATFRNIHVNVYDQNYAAKDLVFSGSWLKEGLTLKELNSSDLIISGITEKAADSGIVDKTISQHLLPRVNLPFPISIEQSHLKQSRIEVFDRHYNISDIKINGDWSGTTLNLIELRVNYANAKILTKGVIDFIDNYPLNLKSKLELDLNRSRKSFP